VTYAYAARFWAFGIECAQAAVDKGSHWYGDDPGQTTRVNDLAALQAWGGTFAAYSDETPMDPPNWEALRFQVWGAAASLEALGEVDDAFYRRLNALGGDLAQGAKDVGAGVAVGLGVGALALIAVGVLLLYREVKA
jgi:hypothetical protein